MEYKKTDVEKMDQFLRWFFLKESNSCTKKDIEELLSEDKAKTFLENQILELPNKRHEKEALIEAAWERREKSSRKDDLQVICYRAQKQLFKTKIKLDWDLILAESNLKKRKPELSYSNNFNLKCLSRSEKTSCSDKEEHFSSTLFDRILESEDELSTLLLSSQTLQNPDTQIEIDTAKSDIKGRLTNVNLQKLLEDPRSQSFLTAPSTYRELLEVLDKKSEDKLERIVLDSYKKSYYHDSSSRKQKKLNLPLSTRKNREAVKYFVERLRATSLGNLTVNSKLDELWIQLDSLLSE